MSFFIFRLPPSSTIPRFERPLQARSNEGFTLPRALPRPRNRLHPRQGVEYCCHPMSRCRSSFSLRHQRAIDAMASQTELPPQRRSTLPGTAVLGAGQSEITSWSGSVARPRRWILLKHRGTATRRWAMVHFASTSLRCGRRTVLLRGWISLRQRGRFTRIADRSGGGNYADVEIGSDRATARH